MIAACYASELVNVVSARVPPCVCLSSVVYHSYYRRTLPQYLEVDVWGPVVFAPLKLLDSLKALRSGRRKAERSFSGLL